MSHSALPRTVLRLGSHNATQIHTRAIASPCRRLLVHTTTPSTRPRHATRLFSTNPTLHKKAGKANKAHARTDSSPPVSAAGEMTATDEAYDLSGLEAQILKAMEKLAHDLGELRAGGRLNPKVVEDLKVQLGHAGKDGHGKEAYRLGDLAQVVVRGRMLQVICGESDYIKSITSAIAASPHSLSPLAPEAASPLTIQVPLPPPTSESRRAAVEAAHKAAEQADKTIQNARQTHNKKLRKFQVSKSVLPDDLQKAWKRMEEVVKKGHEEVKRVAEQAKKVLESS